MNLKDFEKRLEGMDCQQINAKMMASNIERAYIPVHEEFLKALASLKGDRLVFVERQEEASIWYYLIFHGLAFYTYFGALDSKKEMKK